MDMPDSNLILPPESVQIPLRALNMATRRKMANFLNLEGSLVVVKLEQEEFDVVNDVTGLAELAGFQYHEIMNMKSQRNPTTEFLDQWTSRNGTVGRLWQLLYLMERYDVLTDCRQNILKDCSRFEDQLDIEMQASNLNIEQDPTVSTSEMKVDETKYATLDDVREGNQKTKYDAFISYSSEDEADRAFVREMIAVLEVKRNLKLFVPGRDDIPGAAEHTISAYLIERRCKRVAILMSKSFLRSAACDFQVKFAHALAPGARSKRLIPIIRDKNTQLPRILRFLAVCDFSKSDMEEWVWDRLYAAMLAPIGPVTYFEDDEDLRDMTFPTQPRLDVKLTTFPALLCSDVQTTPTVDESSKKRDVSENSWSSTDELDKSSLDKSSLDKSSLDRSSLPSVQPSKPAKKTKSRFSFFDKKPSKGSKKKAEEHFV